MKSKRDVTMTYVGMSAESKERFKQAAEQRELTLSAWIVQACLSYAKTGEAFAKKHLGGRKNLWPSGWPKETVCYRCKQCGHDPLVEHPSSANVDGEIYSVEWEQLEAGVYKSCKP